MKNKTTILLMALTCLALGCKKYEDGPTISLLSKKYRIEGKWEATSILEDNLEVYDNQVAGTQYKINCQSGSTLYASELDRVKTCKFNIKKDGDFEFTIAINTQKVNFSASAQSCKKVLLPEVETFNETEKFKWEFDKKKENFIAIDDGGYHIVYEILELREKRIKLKRVDEDGAMKQTYIFTMEKDK